MLKQLKSANTSTTKVRVSARGQDTQVPDPQASDESAGFSEAYMCAKVSGVGRDRAGH